MARGLPSRLPFMTPIRTPRRTAALLLAILAIGCSSKSDDDATAHGRAAGAKGTVRDSSAGIIAPASTAYHVVPIARPATVTGTVLVDGDLPKDSTVAPTAAEAPVCGTTVPDYSFVHTGNKLANAVVWISNLRAGKPLPEDRRFELTTDHCHYDPRVQAVVTGSTLNVHNDDDAPETTTLFRLGGVDTLEKISLIDDGGVVPTDRIARETGVVELQSRQHPWSRGFVLVFDQPYFAVTATDGSFRIDSLPPGHYRLTAWHERATKPVTQEFDVGEGATAKVEVKLKLKRGRGLRTADPDNNASADEREHARTGRGQRGVGSGDGVRLSS